MHKGTFSLDNERISTDNTFLAINFSQVYHLFQYILFIFFFHERKEILLKTVNNNYNEIL